MGLRLRLGALLLLATGGVMLSAAPPADAVAGAKLVLENERVRVVEYVLEPGVPMGMHSHPRDRVEITVAGGRVRVTTADGKTQEATEKEGAVVFSRASTALHDVVNIGETPLRAYHVELKP